MNLKLFSALAVISACLLSACSSNQTEERPFGDEPIIVNVKYVDPTDLNNNGIPDEAENWLNSQDIDNQTKSNLMYYMYSVNKVLQLEPNMNEDKLDFIQDDIMFNLTELTREIVLDNGETKGIKLVNNAILQVCNSSEKASKYITFIKGYDPIVKIAKNR
ncbi:MAG: hypothetical protein UHD07_03290 [Ruminobacter sp.]|nr:hypothetical protein [Ruminobacter sp.]